METSGHFFCLEGIFPKTNIINFYFNFPVLSRHAFDFRFMYFRSSGPV